MIILHHKKNNNRHSSDNHDNPQHEKNNFPNEPAPQQRKTNFLNKIRERFQEKPATEGEIRQLRLNTVREELKTRQRLAKQKRPSRFASLGSNPAPSYRRSSRFNTQEDSGFFGSSSGKSFLDFGSGPSLSFITGEGKKGKNQKSGIEELF